MIGGLERFGTIRSIPIAAYVQRRLPRWRIFTTRVPISWAREEIRAFLVDLVEQKKVAWSLITSRCWRRLRFFYRHVLRQGEVVEDIRGPRPEKRLPVVLSTDEVARFFKAIPSLKHRTILMLAYGAGLRIGEAVRVRLLDIDRERNVLRVEQGKRKKDRYTILSPALLEISGSLLLAAQPEDLLFTTRFQRPADHDSTVQRVCIQGSEGCGNRQADFATHSAA